MFKKSKLGKSSTKNFIVIGSVVVLSVAATGGANMYLMKKQRVAYESVVADKEAQLERYRTSSKQAFVLNREVEAGQVITEADGTMTPVPDLNSPVDVIQTKEDVVGKVLKITVGAQTAVTENMVYAQGPLDPTVRKNEFNYVRLPIKIDKADTLDLRIVFPTGEDYRVLVKKKMTDVDAINSIMYMDTDEEELLLMQSALVDAYLHNAEIYAIQYVDGEMQEKPVTTYFPNANVQKIIQADPKIVDKARYAVADTIRKSLDQRLKALQDNEKVRVGAELPEGSAVSKQRSTVGAQVIISGENGATPTEQQDPEALPEGFTPAGDSTSVGGE